MVAEGAVNLNDVKTTSLTYCYNTSTNLPVNNYGGGLLTIAATSGVVMQFFVRLNGDVSTRSFSSNAWTAWRSV